MTNMIREIGDSIKLGVIGLSPGNGHPFSWAAICNGYDPDAMNLSGYPVIASYLAEQSWPDAKIQNADVCNVWCEHQEDSVRIAQAALVPNICSSLSELIETSDAILLARDDVYDRTTILEQILAAGCPVFVDKPFAWSENDARTLMHKQRYPGQIFTTSALRYAPELRLQSSERTTLGKIQCISAITPKYWHTYAVHLIEPIIAQFPDAKEKFISANHSDNGVTQVSFYLADMFITITSVEKGVCPISIRYVGEQGQVEKVFGDAFGCFKRSIETALVQWQNKTPMVTLEETYKICRIIGWGAEL